jgi:predicted DNA binding protein
MSTPTAVTGAASTVRVELVVGRPGQCPVAAASDECGGTVRNVARCCTAEGDVAEFTVTSHDQPAETDLDEVFRTDTGTRYRDCAVDCDRCAVSIPEQFDCPVTEIYAEHGDLHLAFYAPDVEVVRDIVETARDRYDDVVVGQLTPTGDEGSPDPVVVDADRLTARQREVLATAYEMGYFDHPKRANAGEVAAVLDISQSTFAEHLAAAQRKLVGALVTDQSPATD